MRQTPYDCTCWTTPSPLALQGDADMKAGGQVYNARVEAVKGKEAKEQVRYITLD